MLTSSVRVRSSLLLLGAAVPVVTLLPDAEVPAPPVQYEVKITNVTRGQIFSPPVVASHNADQPALFTLGSPASAELAGVAEDALNQPLIASLAASPFVRDVQVAMGAGGPIVPGETATVVVSGTPGRDMVSLAGMLVITNDAFVGLNRVALPASGSVTVRAAAYDAGSEANTEDCAHIPGPPCGNPMVRVPTGAEGFVHIHAGIHGIASLAPETYDWRDAVAQVTITRL